MCGITGFVTKQIIGRDDLIKMNDTMIHRGPDDSGAEIYEGKGSLSGYNIGLAQRRLSIIDLTEGGHQPMTSADKSLTIVFNGEIYNYRELKRELTYPFASESDTEVILAAYKKWGYDCVNRFNGMFAFAIYDREHEELFMARDRVGKKPLYYELEGDSIIFGSELKPIITRPGFGKRIRKDVISRYLYHQYILDPDTIFENVYKLEPGSCLRFSKGEAHTWKYWDVAEVYHKMQENPVNDYDEAKAELKKLLENSVRYRMIADVPLGTFLSGGYDSSLVTAVAQSISSDPVKTFSIGFNVEKYNEAKYAAQVAKHLGTDHTELYIDEKEMFDLVDSIAKYYDEPFADSSQIPSMLVCKLAKKDVTVALSGDGGDEFFCGYNIYDKVAQAQKVDFAGAIARGVCGLPGLKQAGLMNRLPFKARVIAGNKDKETKTQFASPYYIDFAEKMVLEDGLSLLYRTESKYAEKNWQIRRMLLDMDTYLSADIMTKMDRASMKYSLESRCPILDKEVMEYSFRLDHSFKYKNGVKKRILKDIAYDYIPRELLDRPKVGFAVPLDIWLRGPLKDELTDYCKKDFLKDQGIFDADFIEKMLVEYMDKGDAGPSSGANFSKLFWSFFVFQQWYKTYINA